jgi:hypothetical protein
MLERWRGLVCDYHFRDNELSERNGMKFARLREDGAQAKLKKVELQDIPTGSLLIKLDACKPLDGVLKPSTEALRRCDYVLIAPYNSRTFIVFIELKSERINLREIEKCFNSSECLWDYFESVMMKLLGHTDLHQNYERRKVLFQKNMTRFLKRRVTVKTSKGKNINEQSSIFQIPIVNGNQPFFKQIIGQR